MNNNDIFKKLRVALQLRDEQIVEILELSDFRISKAELSAFFRSEDHPNYMECGDQVLRNFLNGLVIHLRGTKENPKNAMDVINANREAVKSAPKLSASNEEGKSSAPREFTKKPAPKGPPKSGGGAHKNKSPKRVEQKPQIVEKVKFNNGKKK
ncbi:MAG TPA: DUF1456 family protein [Flavobacterium sp.]|jgi:hypothetical protein|nr:DUF1456 family protein [Flavobacterium sp.]